MFLCSVMNIARDLVFWALSVQPFVVNAVCEGEHTRFWCCHVVILVLKEDDFIK